MVRVRLVGGAFVPRGRVPHDHETTKEGTFLRAFEGLFADQGRFEEFVSACHFGAVH